MAHLNAIDQSTYFIDVSFFNEVGDPVTPTTAVWTLTNNNRLLINGRDQEVIPSVGETAVIVLSGDDLAAVDGEERVLTVQAIYDSTEATNLPLNSEYRFTIENLIAVPNDAIIMP